MPDPIFRTLPSTVVAGAVIDILLGSEGNPGYSGGMWDMKRKGMRFRGLFVKEKNKFK